MSIINNLKFTEIAARSYPHLSPLCPVWVVGSCRRPSSIRFLHCC